MKRTPLYPVYEKYGAKLVTGGIWEVPLRFKELKTEHNCVRQRVGLIDLSSMGEIDCKGEGTRDLLQKLFVNDINRMNEGDVIYSTILREDGGILDDTTIYCFNQNHYLIVTSTPNTEKIYNWIRKNSHKSNTWVTNVSSGIALIGIQGPLSRDLLDSLCEPRISRLEYFHFLLTKITGVECLVSRTGYTGELGYEVFCPAEYSNDLWDLFMNAGKTKDIQPFGIEALLSLRLEKAYLLYGREIDESVNPLEVGLEWTIHFEKDAFIGIDALLEYKKQGIKRKLIGLTIPENKKIDSNSEIFNENDDTIGKITSSGYGYTIEKNIALALVEKDKYEEGKILKVKCGDEYVEVKMEHIPFYDPKRIRIKM